MKPEDVMQQARSAAAERASSRTVSTEGVYTAEHIRAWVAQMLGIELEDWQAEYMASLLEGNASAEP